MSSRLTRRHILLGAAATAVLGACSAAKHRLGVAPAQTTGLPAASPTVTAAPKGIPGLAAQPGSPATAVAHGPRDRRQVALTFHAAGDAALAAQLLDLVGQLHTPITVFGVGQWLDANPQLTARILAEGHELANHTYTHPQLGSLSRAAVAAEIVRCRDTLASHGAEAPGWFRPSGIDHPTAVILEEAARAGYGVSVGFDVDPADYQDPGSSLIKSRVAGMMQPGSIVSLHFGHAGTVAALTDIVTGLRAKGLEPVLVRQLLAP